MRQKPEEPRATATGLEAFFENAAQEMLVVTYWFNPVPDRTANSVSVRFSGHRVGTGARQRPGDEFVQDETIDGIVAGSGPVSVTARIRGINPGEWNVAATVRPDHSARGPRRRASMGPAALPLYFGGWSWRSWSLYERSIAPVKTVLALFARVPGVMQGVYPLMVVLGIVAALAVQSLVVSGEHLYLGPTLAVSMIAIGAGLIGSKVWFVVLHRREHLIHGWCIQGFLTGVAVAAAATQALLNTPIGTFLDVGSPGIFLGLAIGRVGCFFAGCCAGRPTASRWGIWSSDQRVGMRRVPTQLIESMLALSVGIAALGAVLAYRPANGAIFVAALSLYTLGRQGILRLRAERRKSAVGGPLTAAVAACLLIADVVVLALRRS